MNSAIRTRYLKPKGKKPARVRADAGASSMSTPWDHELSEQGNHDMAAGLLLQRMEPDSSSVLYRGEPVDPLERIYVLALDCNKVTP